MRNFLITVTLSMLLTNCNSLYTQYKHLNSEVYKGDLYESQLTIVKYLLNNEDKNSILIISWIKSILDPQDPLRFYALIYTPAKNEIKFIKNTKETPDVFQTSYDLKDRNYKEHLYILRNYLDGNENYLLSLKDSNSSSDANTPFYIYDFNNKKKLKIKSFAFDKDGKIINDNYDPGGWD